MYMYQRTLGEQPVSPDRVLNYLRTTTPIKVRATLNLNINFKCLDILKSAVFSFIKIEIYACIIIIIWSCSDFNQG